MDVRLHAYYPKRTLLLLEYIFKLNLTQPRQEQHQPRNALLFIGGMYDNFRSPRYVDDLAALFPRDVPGQKWSVFHVQLTSANKGWGMVDLDRDVEEISQAITYIRTSITKSPMSPVVIMGHSTGCQDSMHYMSSPVTSSSHPRPAISGLILQAPVSDREALLDSIRSNPSVASAYKEALALCAATPKELYTKTTLPWHLNLKLMGPVPTNLSRFLSLASPDSPASPGPDDYFSSDLGDEIFKGTFGKLASCEHILPAKSLNGTKSMLMLPSGSDEHVNPRIDKALLLSRWKKAIESSSSSTAAAISSPHTLIVKNALHDISGTGVEARTARLIDMRGAVLSYLDEVVGDIDGDRNDDQRSDANAPWAIWRRDKDEIETEKGLAGVKL